MRNGMVAFALICGSVAFASVKDTYFSNWPKGSDPVEVGNRIGMRFLGTQHTLFGNPKKAATTAITYPDVCTWLGGLWFANETGNKVLKNGLIKRFDPLLTTDSRLQPPPNHVDNSVFGSLPLELYLQTKESKYKQLGLKYADAQWELPKGWTLKGQPKRASEEYGMLSDAHIFQPEQKEWADKGYSWQTRFWLDDMFMITALQGQAYRATGDRKYVDRAAREMVLYLSKIQLPNGLFNHAVGVPFRWARGNGWMAVGVTELLRVLPKDNKDRPAILAAYRKMMASLLKYQDKDGMWLQLIDDASSWKETSGSAMFAYAFIIGVQQGWLAEKEYGPAARKAWIALSKYVNQENDVEAVCEGTNIKNDRQHYLDRKKIVGDLHGQAPVLWCAYALVRK